MREVTLEELEDHNTEHCGKACEEATALHSVCLCTISMTIGHQQPVVHMHSAFGPCEIVAVTEALSLLLESVRSGNVRRTSHSRVMQARAD